MFLSFFKTWKIIFLKLRSQVRTLSGVLGFFLMKPILGFGFKCCPVPLLASKIWLITSSPKWAKIVGQNDNLPMSDCIQPSRLGMSGRIVKAGRCSLHMVKQCQDAGLPVPS